MPTIGWLFFIKNTKVRYAVISSGTSKPSYLKSAAILAVSAIIAKIIGAIFKLPLYMIISPEATTHFGVTYQIYAVLLALSYSGLPVALSRLVSASAEIGNTRQARKYFSTAIPLFMIIGGAFSVLMFIFAPQLANFMNDPQAMLGIRVLSPGVFFCCVVSVYEGYSQGHQQMIPTAVKQLLEVVMKLVFGLIVVWIVIKGGGGDSEQAAGAVTGVVAGLGIAIPVLMVLNKKYHGKEKLAGSESTSIDTVKTILKVSIPISLGAASLAIITLIDMKVVLGRLVTGAGLARNVADSYYGVFLHTQTLYNIVPSLLSPISISIVPALAAHLAAKKYREARMVTESSMKLVALLAAPCAVGLTVLAPGIMGLLYAKDGFMGFRLLQILAPASFFGCFMIYTTAVLQANGYERIPLVAFLVGGGIQIAVDHILCGNPAINIYGSPIGTFVCFFVICAINFGFIKAKVPSPPRVFATLIKPVAISLVMGVGAYFTYALLARFITGVSRVSYMLRVVPSIAVAAVIYIVLVLALHVITKDDLAVIPKGDKIAKLLRIK
ncbi:MAG: oligosaccharide flippase family protein [Oscillospiraceae bacterium]|nr:oligosaccharide flippase family protein [Oscillospiraceae bacterium]